MLFQCSARLTLIWLSGSALLPCQPVWATVKLFEGGWRRGGSVFVPSRDGLQGCRTSVCSQTLTHKLSLTFSLLYPSRLFIPCICSLSLAPLFFSFFLLLPPSSLSLSVFHFLCLTHAGTRAHTHTRVHSFPPLSLQSLIKGIMTVWFGGNSDAPLFCWVFPQTTKTQHRNVDVNWMWFFFF